MDTTTQWTIEGDAPIEITRDGHGVPHVRAASERDGYRGLGHCHGTDRALQLLLQRVIAEGRVAELLDDSEDSVRLDRFFRRLHLGARAGEEIRKLPAGHLALAQAYCDGVNLALMQGGVPWELRVLGYTPAPWTLRDLILVSRLTGYVGLAQSQGEMERLLVEMVKAGVSRKHLDEIFPDVLDGLDVELVRHLSLGERLVPEHINWSHVVPRGAGSNNWVVAGSKTVSGYPILANDPHLEVNRLPAIWYEIVLELPDRFCIAATMPGLPGLLLGRTNDLAWGATYSFMDTIDSWVEDCREGRYRRVVDGREQWLPFRTRTEVIKRKRGEAVTVTFYENDHGVLDGDPHQRGFQLTTRWSGALGGAASLSGASGVLHATNVRAGMALLGKVETSWNWVLADRQGSIGYQMSGLMPQRGGGARGLVPRPGWDPANDWQGFVPCDALPRTVDPESGIIVTANDDLNHLGQVAPINLPMGPSRAERIAEILAARDDWSMAAMEAMQMDVLSPHALRYLEVLRPLLPVGAAADILRAWDGTYHLESKGAALFERFYEALVVDVFGAVCGAEVLRHLLAETGILTDFYDNFDRVLLRPDSVWYGDAGRDATFERVLPGALAGSIDTWGRHQEVVMKHILFGDRLPAWMGFDHGPIRLRGGRGTIHQGQVYRSGGRLTSFAPSFRLVTDLGEHEVRTGLAGGPSDRRFSRWYTSGISDWLAGRFKTLRPKQT